MAKTETKPSDETKSEEVKKKVGNTYVTTPFRDKDNFDKEYEVDQDVSELTEARIKELKAAGVVETYAEPKKDGDTPPAA